MDRADARAARARRAAAALLAQLQPATADLARLEGASLEFLPQLDHAEPLLLRARSSRPATSACRTARSRRAAPTARSSRTTRSSGTAMVGLAGEGRNFDGNGSYDPRRRRRRLAHDVNSGRSSNLGSTVIGNANFVAARHEPALPEDARRPYKLDGAVLPQRAAGRQRPAGRPGPAPPSTPAPTPAPVRNPGTRNRATRACDATPPATTQRDERGGDAVRTAIRKHLRDFIAIVVLVLIAGFVGLYVLAHQRTTLPALGAVRRQGRLHAQGRVLDRAGDHAGPGADGRHRRRAGRRDHERRARRRPRGRDDAARAEVRGPRPPERDDAAAPEDGPQGHGRRARPRHAVGRAGGRATATRCPSRTRCRTSTSTRSSRVLDARHAHLPAAAAQRRRDRPRGPGRRPRAGLPPLRADRARRARRSRRCCESAAATSSARSTTSASSRTRSRARDEQLGDVRRQLERGLPATSRTRREPAADDRAAAARRCATRTPRSRQAKAFADQAGPALAGAACPERARARPVARRDAAVPARDDADHPEPVAPVHAASRRRSSRRCARRRPSFANATPNLTTSFGVLNAFLNGLAYNPPGKSRGLPLLPRLAQPRHQLGLLGAGRAGRRSAAASWSSTCGDLPGAQRRQGALSRSRRRAPACAC